MYKIIFAIVLGGIIATIGGKLMMASDYVIGDDGNVWIDDAFGGQQKQYDRELASGEEIRLGYYTGLVFIPTKIFNKKQEKVVAKTSQSESKKRGYDIDKLAKCVAVAETSGCTTGMGRTKNNCFGIMIRPNGKRTGKRYATKQQSFEHFKNIWDKSYGAYPNWKLANKRTGGDNTKRWLNTVNSCYYK